MEEAAFVMTHVQPVGHPVCMKTQLSICIQHNDREGSLGSFSKGLPRLEVGNRLVGMAAFHSS